jgi:hypothetical protein
MVAATVQKVEVSWDQFIDGHLPENPARNAWREAVAEVATKAKQALPHCNGRVEKAVAIVLAGDVELLPEGKAKVASQSNGTTTYLVVNGECPCKDLPKAPQGFCKHRLSAAIAKRATALAKGKLAQLDGKANGQHPPEHAMAEHVTAHPTADSAPGTSIPLQFLASCTASNLCSMPACWPWRTKKGW